MTLNTWLALDLAVSVALGERWLDRPTKRGTVLIVDEESGLKRLKRRLGAVQRGHGVTRGQELPIAFTSLQRLDLLSEQDVARLEEVVKKHRPLLVVVDALVDVMPGGDENSTADTQPLFQTLRWLADTYGHADVTIHHTNRKGSYRGSSAIPDAVDLQLKVSLANGDSDVVVIQSDKTRDIEAVSFSARAHFDRPNDPDGRVWFTIEEGAPPRSRKSGQLSPSKRYVIRYLSERGQAWLAEMAANAKSAGLSEKTVRNAVPELAADGLIRRCNDGAGGKGALYELTDEGRTQAAAMGLVS